MKVKQLREDNFRNRFPDVQELKAVINAASQMLFLPMTRNGQSAPRANPGTESGVRGALLPRRRWSYPLP